MLGSIHLENFRCFDNTDVSFKNKRGTLKPNVYIFGENSSGKSSVLLSIGFLKHITEGYRINLEMRQTKHLDNSSIKPFVLKDTFLRHYRKNATEPMRLKYEIVLDGKAHFYEVVFSCEGLLISESLTRIVNNRTILIFEATETMLRLGRNVVLLKDQEEVRIMHRKSFGIYTMLSFFSYLRVYRKDVALKASIDSVMEFVDHISVVIDGHYNQREMNGFLWNSSTGAVKGSANKYIKELLEVSEPLLNELVKSTFPLVDHVKYAFTKENDNYWRYELMTYKVTKLGIIEIAPDNLPSGLHRFLDVVVCIFELMLGRMVIIDQLDLKMHQSPFLNVVLNVIPKLPGQSIVTIDSLDSMNHLEPSSIYVTKIDDLDFSVHAIETLSPSQPNHNIRNRYEQGVYGTPIPLQPNMMHNHIDCYMKQVEVLLETKANILKNRHFD